MHAVDETVWEPELERALRTFTPDQPLAGGPRLYAALSSALGTAGMEPRLRARGGGMLDELQRLLYSPCLGQPAEAAAARRLEREVRAWMDDLQARAERPSAEPVRPGPPPSRPPEWPRGTQTPTPFAGR